MAPTDKMAKTDDSRILTGPYADFDLKEIRSEVAIVTPGEARFLRDTCNFERQRPIKSENVKRLLSEAQRGMFIRGTPVFICVLPNGTMRIVNGNHTLEMVAALDHPVPLTLIYAKVKDEKEIGNAYATFDLHKMRSWMDALRAQEKSEAGDIPLARYVLSGLGYIISGFRSGATGIAESDVKSRSVRFDMMEEYRSAADVLAIAARSAPNTRKVLRPAVFSVALATTRHQPRAGAEFWGGFAHDDGLASSDPRKALLRYIENNTSPGGVAQTDTCRAAILSWNAAFKNEPLSVCRPNTIKTLRILGTPFGRNEVAQPKYEKATETTRSTPPSGRLFDTGYDTNMRPASIFKS